MGRDATYQHVKRALDVVVAGTGLVVLLPSMFVIGVAVLVSVGRPVLFRQARPGLHGELFTILKFRTMRHEQDEAGRPRPDHQRLTRVGRLLRSTSLDELPELWNVFKGEMSLVGPRPLLVNYLPLYSEEQVRRHEVRPGITGWAQVNGRNSVPWEERFRMDVWYVENRSLLLDLRILATTLLRVVQARDISAPGHVAQPPFQGREERTSR